ncbi:hypothetical protein NON20_22990 [Synechocystis sp. B12]|jgi:hypothetical protein|nr:hypothetical protein NON20_22990 [Synechocystis sp. B12]
MDFSSVSKSCDFNAVVEPTYWRETPRPTISSIAQKDWLGLAWPVVNAMENRGLTALKTKAKDKQKIKVKSVTLPVCHP